VRKIVFLISLTWGSKLGLAAPALKCADVASISFGSEVKIEWARITPPSRMSPEHCEVRGTIWPENKFAVKLPPEWNHGFYMVGNGGTAGTISFAAMEPGVRKGFAAASTNTGHDAEKEQLASFARPGPDNPDAERKLIDFGYLAMHETAVVAKKIIQVYYGEAARYSYYVGCSTGGRQGLSEAQRFPEDFDGLVVGAPVLNLGGTQMRNIWNAQAVRTGPGAIAPDKLPLLAKAVYRKCDGVDGLEDGLIDDPRQCPFDPARDLPKCPADRDGPDCFTSAQMESLRRVYGGVRTSAGKQIFPGQPLGAEIAAPKSGWDGWLIGPAATLLRSESYMRFILLDPPPERSWTFKAFDFDRDPPGIVKNAAKVNATNPDLRPLKKRGGKIIHYHGWADPGITALMSVDYYESVVEKMGRKQTSEFYRLFMIPGMFHCGGGVGCGTVDWVTPIVDWVEKGTAPENLIGSRVEEGKSLRARPLCPYPEVAVYKGAGSIDDAGIFICSSPR